jgi:hypothetical protein
MLILVLMLLIGLFAGVWGFMMCFLPQRWDRLTETISFADRWTVPSPKRLHPIIRLGHRAVGIVICIVGCWFAYVAASRIYVVVTGRAALHTLAPLNRNLASSPTTIGNVFSLLMIVAGAIIALVPAKAVMVCESVWPAGRSLKSSAAPKIILLVRLMGAILVLLAIMFLMR